MDYHSDALHFIVAFVGASVFLPHQILSLKKGYSWGPTIIVIIPLIAAAWLCYVRIANDNYPDFNHWIFAVAFSYGVAALLAFLIVGLLPSRRQAAAPQAEHKKCPFCAEVIKAEAVKCRFCGSNVPPAKPTCRL